MSEKRFVVENGNNEVSIKDKVEDNYPFVLAYEHIDDADNLIQECLFLVGLLNEQQATIIELQERIIDLKDDKNQLHKVISKLRQEVAELKTRNSVLSSKLNQIPKSIKEVWLDE